MQQRSTSKSFVEEIHRLPVDRRQLVFRVRRQLAEGTYDIDAKLPEALDKMVERLFPGLV